MKKKSLIEKKLLHITVLFVLGLMVFFKTTGYDFVWDDIPLYLNQTNYPAENRMQNLGMFWTPGDMPMYAPVTYTLWGIIASVSSDDDTNKFGISPSLFHLVNILFHLLNSILIYLILSYLFKNPLIPLIGAAIFLFHPIQVEAVAWISELRGLLAGFFGFLGILLYVKHKGNHDEFRFNSRLAIVCFFLILSFLSKPTGVVFLIIIPVLEIFYFKSVKAYIIKTVILFAGILIPLVLLSVFAESGAAEATEVSAFNRLLLPFYSFIFYLYKVLIPVNLTAVYGRTPEFVIQTNQIYIYTAVFAIIISAFIIKWKKLKDYFPGLLIAFIAILPVSGLISFYYQTFSNVADRYFYIAMFGFVIFISTLLLEIKKSSQSYFLSIFIVLVLIILSVNQTSNWANEYTHWDNVIKNSSVAIPQAYMGRGEENIRFSEYQKALEDFTKAIDLDPDEALYYYNRANVYLDLNDYKKAVNDYTTSITLNDKFVNAYVNRGMAFSGLDKDNLAIRDFKAALTINANQSDVLNSIGISFARLGQYDSAAFYFRKAIVLNPGDIEAGENLKRLKNQIKGE